MLSNADIETITNLIKIGKRIKFYYKDGNSCKDILNLIEVEDSLIESLKLTNTKLEQINKSILDKSKIDYKQSFLSITSPGLSESNYEYYRLLSRINYMYGNKFGSNVGKLNLTIMDEETEIMYKMSQEKGLKNCYMILMDSPTVERNILERNMVPEETYTNIVKLGTDAVIIKEAVENEKRIHGKVYVFPYNYENLHESIRVENFNKKIEVIINRLARYIRLSTAFYKDSQTFKILKNYILTILMFMPPEERLDAYDKLLDIARENCKSKDPDELCDYVEEQFYDLENIINNNVKTLSFVNPKNI